MEIAPEHLSYEALPVAIGIIRGRHVVYLNPAFEDLMRLRRVDVVGQDFEALAEKLIGASDRRWVQELHARQVDGKEPTPHIWIRLQLEHARVPMVQALRSDGPRPGERLYVVMPAETESMVREFTEKLAAGAARLMQCRSEEQVLDCAVQIIFENQLAASTLLPDGEFFRHGPMRQPAEALAFAEKLAGRSMREVLLPRKLLPHLDRVLETGKAMFHHEFLEVIRPTHPPEVIEKLARLPKVFAVDAPIFVDGKPHATISAMGPQLTPSLAAAVELFARQVGAAIENARHHALAAEQLKKLSALQTELVAQERLAVLGAAAGVLAHEVRNPLAAMINGVSILRRDHTLTAEGERVLAMVDEESQRLDRLVHDLLDFTRPLEPRRTSVELADVPRRAVALLRERREDQGVNIDFSASEGAHLIHGDAHLLGLAVENLLRNAVQASPKGGRVTLRLEGSAGSETLIVEDEGSGVDEKDVARIFEPFFTTRAKGSGLGLPIVLRIAKAHGGTVKVSRGATGGARFDLSLPKS